MSKSSVQLKFKKVLWISDRNYPEYNGGAERTDYVIREAGKKLGLEIEWTNDLPKEDADFDFLVISNIHMWPNEKASELLWNEYPSVFFSHDPLAHPWYAQAIKQSFCTVFMSPAHADFYKKKFVIRNHFIQPHGIIDLDKWFSKKKKKDYYLYIGDLNPYKGVQNVYAWAKENPDKEVRLWGRNFARFPFELDNFKFYGWLDEEKVAETLAEAEYFIHLPEQIDPCPRMITFAYLSGCTIIGNDNIGLSSYDWPWDDPEAIKEILRKAPKKFWFNLNKYYRKKRR